MDELTILRTVVTCTTILAAAMVAANMNARITVAGFAIFIVASIAWMADGWFESKTIPCGFRMRFFCSINILFLASGAGCQWAGE